MVHKGDLYKVGKGMTCVGIIPVHLSPSISAWTIDQITLELDIVYHLLIVTKLYINKLLHVYHELFNQILVKFNMEHACMKLADINELFPIGL
jgi:hypothetical protein